MLAIIVGFLFSLTPPENPAGFAIASDTIKHSKRNYHSTTDSIKYVQISRVIVIGNRVTRNSIILRELSFKKGDIVSLTDLPVIIQKDQRKLYNLRLFNTVTIKPLDLGNGSMDLLVEVHERWYTFPVPIFQLSDRNFNEWWENYNHDFSRVNYGLKLYQFNMWGRNQTMKLTAQFGFQKRFEFHYTMPYINKKQKQGLIIETDYSEAKSVADSTIDHKLDYFKFNHSLRRTGGVGITYTYRNNFYIQHRLKYEYRQTTIADTLHKLNPNYLREENRKQQYDAVTYEFISDHRDVIAYPLKGYQFYIHLQQTGLAIRSDVNKTEGFVGFSGFLDLKKNFYLANMSFIYASTPDNLPYYNYGAMGYNKIFVRGYEIYVIEGPNYFLNKTTLKKRVFSRNWKIENSPISQFTHFPLSIYLKTYADAGYTNNYNAYERADINTRLSDKFIGGGGFGIDFVCAYDVVLRFEYTFTSQKTNGLFFHIKKEF